MYPLRIKHLVNHNLSLYNPPEDFPKPKYKKWLKTPRKWKKKINLKEYKKLYKDLVDAKNDADTALHTTEKSLNEYKDKL